MATNILIIDIIFLIIHFSLNLKLTSCVVLSKPQRQSQFNIMHDKRKHHIFTFTETEPADVWLQINLNNYFGYENVTAAL